MKFSLQKYSPVELKSPDEKTVELKVVVDTERFH